MQRFIAQGDHHNDLWLVDNSPVFAIFPGGIVGGVDSAIPIYLKVGNPSFGETHIKNKHYRWIVQQKFKSVAELVYCKLSQPGYIYCTEVESKLKIMMNLKPSALLVMELLVQPDVHFSVITIYHHQGALDGQVIGRYPGRR